ncbi:hypothetical protein V8F06_007735 [Rhypophila decipiens]
MFPSTKAFRILYNTLYYALYLILLGVLIVSPADLMRQAVMHRNNTNVLIIAASYLVTILVLLVIYFGRLYINRSVLTSIPKGWIPVDKSDGVPRKVREVIVTELSRSAAIAWGARPRVELVDTGGSRTGTAAAAAGTGTRETAATHADGGAAVAKEKKNTKGLAVAVDSEQKKRPHHRIISKLRSGSCTGGGSATMTEKDSDMATAAAVASVGVIPPKDAASPPVWGEIEHPGWASPTSPDLPNLQYNAVISELPNLIEAKALTLAPLDPASSTDPPALDPDAVAVLQRPETMGLREYLVQLTEMEVLAPAVVGPFIAQYEAARFSTRPVSNHQFRQLMHLFAELLRAMQPLDPAVLLEEYDEDDDDDDGEEDGDYASAIYDTDIDNDAPRGSSSSSLSLSVQEEGDGHNLQNKNDNNHLINDNFNNKTNNLQITRQKSSSSSADSMSSQRRYSIATRTSNLAGGGLPPSGRNTPLSMALRNSSANSTWQQQHSQSHSLSQTFRTAPTTPKSRRTITGTFEDDDDGRSSRSFSSVRTDGSIGIIGANKTKKKKKNSMAAGNSSPDRELVSGGNNRVTTTTTTATTTTTTTTKSNRKSTSTSTSGTRNDGNGKAIEMEIDNFAQTRHPYIPGGNSSGGSGSVSVRSGNSGASNSSSNGSGRSGCGGSVVIRLASGQEESSSGLPYILEGRIG